MAAIETTIRHAAVFPAEALRIEQGAGKLRSYCFKPDTIEYFSCENCRTQTFAAGATSGGIAMRAINLRCVQSLDLDGIRHRAGQRRR